MILDRQNGTTLFTQESISLAKFVGNFKESYEKCKADNIIVNLLSISNLEANDLMEFHEISNAHLEGEKSFVIVSDSVNYNDLNGDLVVVPSLQEAYDLIEMEEIERDLNA